MIRFSRFGAVLCHAECIGFSVCWSDCPEVFEEGPGYGKSQIVGSLRLAEDPAQGEAPEALRSSAEGAAANCPVAE